MEASRSMSLKAMAPVVCGTHGSRGPVSEQDSLEEPNSSMVVSKFEDIQSLFITFSNFAKIYGRQSIRKVIDQTKQKDLQVQY